MRDRLTLLITKHKAKIRQEENAENAPGITCEEIERDQAERGRRGHTVKRHFEHLDHSHFLCLRGKLVVHSKRSLYSRIFPPWTTFPTQSFHGAVRRRCLRSLIFMVWPLKWNRFDFNIVYLSSWYFTNIVEIETTFLLSSKGSSYRRNCI